MLSKRDDLSCWDVAGKVLSARQKDQEAAMCLILMH